jgi:DNA-binding LytR/AlgR family response regulator
MQTAFFIRLDGKLQSIPFEDVLFISAKNNYCEIVTTGKKKYLVYVTMTCLEQRLPDDMFIRVHRSYIISIKKIEWLNCNKMAIEGHEIPVSKEGHKEVLRHILIICPDSDDRPRQEIEAMSLKEHKENNEQDTKIQSITTKK